MVYCDRIEVFQGIYVNKTGASKDSNVSHNWYFLDNGLSLNRMYVCNGCHDISITLMNPSNVDILNICHVDYHCIIDGTSKNEAVNLLENVDFSEKIGSLEKIIFLYCV